MMKLSSIGLRAVLATVAAVATAAWVVGVASAGGPGGGAVYTLTNQAAGNAVAVFDRASDGTLTATGLVSTGGLGSGGGLGNQGALVLAGGGRFLYAVNAGSNDLSAFRIGRDRPVLIDRIGSGGAVPISVTVHRDVLYALNAGDGIAPGSISGFQIGQQGTLSAIPGSTRLLSATAVGPAQIQFDPTGETLVVTEKDTNAISTYTVDRDGIPAGPNVQASNGATPFGFAFDRRGHLIVSEAFGGAASALSSYEVDRTGLLTTISPSVLAGAERAACWVVVTRNGKYAYTTNTGSGTISAYAIGHDGSLTLLDAVAAAPGGSPIDAALSGNGRFLYALNSSLGTIDAFRVSEDGALTPLAGGAGGLPSGANGLAAA